jgi:hypothetical protein
MSATTLLRENPGLFAMVMLLAIGTLVFVSFGIVMARSGASLRPVLFVAGLFALVLLPQFAFHLGTATGVVPKRSLTWIPAADRGSVYGWLEQEPALGVREGTFADLAAVFGPEADVTLGSNLRAAAVVPFAGAEAAHMVVLPPAGSAIVARFASSSVADAAAREYARLAIGTWPDVGNDGWRTARRPGGDVVKFVLVGRTLVIVTGAEERALAKQARTLGALAPAAAPSDPGSEHYWLYRPGVLPAVLAGLLALYVFAFFRGAAWAAAVPPAADTQPLSAFEVRQRLLAIDSARTPFEIAEEANGQRIVVTWRFADARWVDLARARKLRYVSRVILDFDERDVVVRVTEQMTRFDADAGIGGASLEWRTMRGVTFFHVERGRVFGLQFDASGRPQPKLDYTWTFDAREMKAPLIEIITRAGWQWRPVPWSGPESLRWLTD